MSMAPESPADFNARALDPRRSVVVEACAGSGKTWLLVSRVIRLLLDGVPPSEILAITFTRKAAQEMDERLREWLADLSIRDDAWVSAFLRERSVPETDIAAMLPRARSLYEAFLTAQPGLTISTFHGWFMQLLRRAPIDAGVLGAQGLTEQTSGLTEEAWERFAAALQSDPDGDLARRFDMLLERYGRMNIETLLQGFLRHRAEWQLHTDAKENPVSHALSSLGVDPSMDPVAALNDDVSFSTVLAEYRQLLALGSDTLVKSAERLVGVEGCVGDRFPVVMDVLLTKKLEPRKLKPGKKMDPDKGARLTALHDELCARLQTVIQQQTDQDARRINEAALSCGVELLAAYESVKESRQVIDFGDIEWRALRLLTTGDHAEYMQYKLDARYRHILLDEFQDTNPVQWMILLAWFRAAAEADAPPGVFLVGDPKQSIYRFRRAEARLFDVATAFLRQEMDAEILQHNESRRCAPVIISALNNIFRGVAAFPHFIDHTAHYTNRPGRVMVLPLALDDGTALPGLPVEHCVAGLRNPLLAPFETAEDTRRRAEAAQLAGGIADIVGRWGITDEKGATRPATYADVMVLSRRRIHLRVYERALRDAGIPFVTSRLGGLLDTLEADDLNALLGFLVSPFDDLRLAHALRSPVFSASDDDLVALARRDEASWWPRLQGLVRDSAASPELVRAERLLTGWLASADRRPVHDQLDRIYFEGDVLRRYAAVVPAAMWPSVRANLMVFLQQALSLDGGRYPSLPRFLNELTALREAPDEEAPSEGISGGGENAVRILTVHGAKGLEAPVVWLIDTATGEQPERGYATLVEWPPENDRPTHFSLCFRKAEQAAVQRQVIANESERARTEDYNLLYVAMTRAKQALVVSGCDGRNAGESWHQRIATALGDESVMPDGSRCIGDNLSLKDQQKQIFTNNSLLPPVVVDPRMSQLLPTGQLKPQDAGGHGVEYGLAFHRLMERLATAGAADADALARELELPRSDVEVLLRQAKEMLARPDLTAYFDPAQYVRALNEVPYVDASGELRRIDRLVETKEAVWVLDYKTGVAPDGGRLMADYEAQILSYCHAVAKLYPGRQVRGLLLFAGGGQREVAVD